MSDDFEVEPFERAMWDEVKVLAEKRAQLEALQDELVVARDSAHSAISRYGAALSIDRVPVPRSVVRTLYWEHRDIHADAIAKAFAIPGCASNVHGYAGADHFDVLCPAACGASVRLAARTSRSACA